MESFGLLIDGQIVPGDSTMPAINPATEETIVDCPRASLNQLNQAVAAAKAAFPAGPRHRSANAPRPSYKSLK